MLDLKITDYHVEGGKIASFREKLLAWYDANKQDLPGEGHQILIKFGSPRDYAPTDTC